MRLLLFSDLHLDRTFGWAASRPGLARKLRNSLEHTLSRILNLAPQKGVDAVLCGGDLYEQERFSKETENFLRTSFEKIHPLPVFIAPGNHDWFGAPCLYQRVEWPDNVHIFQTTDFEPITLDEGITLWGAAHLKPAGTRNFLDDFQVDRDGIHLALFHGSENSWFTEQGSGKERHAPFDAEQIEAAGIHHAFLGHYHHPKDAERFTYPGNPHPLGFRETGLRGPVLIEVKEAGAVERERLAVDVMEFVDVELDITGCASVQDVRGRLSERIAGRKGMGHITVAGDMSLDLQLQPGDLQDITSDMVAVLVEWGEVHPAYDFDEIKNETTIRGQFVKNVLREEGWEEAFRRKVLLTGLRALDGRDDLEIP